MIDTVYTVDRTMSIKKRQYKKRYEATRNPIVFIVTKLRTKQNLLIRLHNETRDKIPFFIRIKSVLILHIF